jgi:hypothetical protein
LSCWVDLAVAVTVMTVAVTVMAVAVTVVTVTVMTACQTDLVPVGRAEAVGTLTVAFELQEDGGSG